MENSPALPPPHFGQAPYTLAWEITRACALACVHCRAQARPRRDPRELTTAEGKDLVDQAAGMGVRVLVITGGDPLMRPDCFDFIRHANRRGLRVGFSPSATGRLTRGALEQARDAGVHRIHISLDGASPAVHDRFRGVSGSFDRTIAAIGQITDLEIGLQIGTTASRANIDELPAIASIAEEWGAKSWVVFFLVPTGRAQVSQMLDAEEHERVMDWLADYRATAGFEVRTTAGMQFRRILAQKGIPYRVAVPSVARVVTPAPVNDGDGFCFVSHSGEVCPSGFLQISAGNVREQPLAALYRSSPLFRDLRDRSLLRGRCGRCEYRAECGGSRARAWAVTGDYLAEDPSCAYKPQAAVGVA